MSEKKACLFCGFPTAEHLERDGHELPACRLCVATLNLDAKATACYAANVILEKLEGRG